MRIGLAICAFGVTLALSAPLIATDQPLMAKAPCGLCFPAFRPYPLIGPWLACTEISSTDWGRWRREGAYPDRIRVSLHPLIPHSPQSTNLEQLDQPPSSTHWMGTDSLGRDVAARLVHGFPIALLVGGVATTLSLLLGLVVGAAAGGGGPWVDLLLTRLIDLVSCFPSLVLALALVATVDRPGLGTLIVAIAATRWTGVARFFRGEVLRQRSLTYCSAARAAGAREGYLLFRHILPNALAPLLVTAAFSVSSVVLLEAGMSFLGLGVAPPTPSWGAILAEAQRQVRPCWWLILFPSLALFVTVLGCNLLAEGFRDSTDPRISKI